MNFQDTDFLKFRSPNRLGRETSYFLKRSVSNNLWENYPVYWFRFSSNDGRENEISIDMMIGGDNGRNILISQILPMFFEEDEEDLIFKISKLKLNFFETGCLFKFFSKCMIINNDKIYYQSSSDEDFYPKFFCFKDVLHDQFETIFSFDIGKDGASKTDFFYSIFCPILRIVITLVQSFDKRVYYS